MKFKFNDRVDMLNDRSRSVEEIMRIYEILSDLHVQHEIHMNDFISYEWITLLFKKKRFSLIFLFDI